MHGRMTKMTKQRGFTLVEIAISLIILGVFITPLLVLYDQYNKKQQVETTHKNVQSAYARIEEFYHLNKRYPMPAPLDVASGAAGNGQEVAPSSVPAGPSSCANGVCVETNTNTSPAFIARGLGTATRVVIGAIPFKDLQIEEKDALDAYGSRLVYAVTESMADPDPSKSPPGMRFDLKGAISLVDETGAERTSPPGKVAFVVLSNGPNKTGSINLNGLTIQSCAGASLDTENCNPGFEGGAPSNGAKFRSMLHQANTANEFDDVLISYGATYDETWELLDPTQPVGDMEDVSAQRIGVGADSPAAELDIVSGADTKFNSMIISQSAAADDGKLLTDDICDSSGNNCFKTEDLLSLDCDSTEFFTGIKDKEPICADHIEVRCPPGQLFLGLNTDGSAKCDIPQKVSCEPEVRTDGKCENGDSMQYSLPAAPHGTSYVASIAPPASALQDYDLVIPYKSYPVGLPTQPAGRVEHLKEESCRAAIFTCNDGKWEPPAGAANWQGECFFRQEIKQASYHTCKTAEYWVYERTKCNAPSEFNSHTDWVNWSDYNHIDCHCKAVVDAEWIECKDSPKYAGTNSSVQGKAFRQRIYGRPVKTVPCAVVAEEWNYSECGCVHPPEVDINNPATLTKTEYLDCPNAGEETDSNNPYRVVRTYNPASCTWTEKNEGTCACNAQPGTYEKLPDCDSCKVPKTKAVYDRLKLATECRIETNAEVETAIAAGRQPQSGHEGSCIAAAPLLTDMQVVNTSNVGTDFDDNAFAQHTPREYSSCDCPQMQDDARPGAKPSRDCFRYSSGTLYTGKCRCKDTTRAN